LIEKNNNSYLGKRTAQTFINRFKNAMPIQPIENIILHIVFLQKI